MTVENRLISRKLRYLGVGVQLHDLEDGGALLGGDVDPRRGVHHLEGVGQDLPVVVRVLLERHLQRLPLVL